jgi:hypothetical protein
MMRYNSFQLIGFLLCMVNKELHLGHDKEANAVYALGIQRRISAMETPVRNPARKPTHGQAN